MLLLLRLRGPFQLAPSESGVGCRSCLGAAIGAAAAAFAVAHALPPGTPAVWPPYAPHALNRAAIDEIKKTGFKLPDGFDLTVLGAEPGLRAAGCGPLSPWWPLALAHTGQPASVSA